MSEGGRRRDNRGATDHFSERQAASDGRVHKFRVMGIVGLRLSEARPADHAAGPITTSRGIVRDESLETDGRRALPASVRISIVGYAGVRTAAGSREHEQPLVLLDECLEIACSACRTKIGAQGPGFYSGTCDFGCRRLPGSARTKRAMRATRHTVFVQTDASPFSSFRQPAHSVPRYPVSIASTST